MSKDNMTSKNHIEQALALVQTQITKRLTVSLLALTPAARLLSDLGAAGSKMTKSFSDISEVGPEFHKGVVEVMNALTPILSCLGTNVDEVLKDEKAEKVSNPDEAMALFDERFVEAVKSESAVQALGTLRVLKAILQKNLNWQSSGQPTPSIDKDPFQTTPTKVEGSIEALQAQNSGPAPVLRKSDDSVYWPRDMAARTVSATLFGDAVAAVVKSEEPTDAVWDFDMAPKARRR